jgi:hypothetical protein
MALDAKAAREFADRWIAAWNSHDLERIVDQFSEDALLVSPRVVELLGDPKGEIRGRPALRAYFTKGLKAAPNLRFELTHVYRGIEDLALEYQRHDGRRVVEVMEIDAARRVKRAAVYYTSP